IGEGIITALTAGAVASARPDLVYLLRQPPARTATTATAARSAS
ncbi:MAG: cobalamin biosynthesis protein CbiM, partial [Actinobacteria bacterium]|nr:cobalamin biosynthesis protein CbiM [Actinomycetota bacterium]